MRVSLCLFLLLCAISAADEVPVVHLVETFHLSSKSEEIQPDYDLHTLTSCPEGEKPTEDGHRWLRVFASYVESDARDNGYINENTREAYEREIAILRSGRWPVTFITPQGKEDVLLGMAYAIRWNDEPLPVELRFFGKGIKGLPEKIRSTEKIVVGAQPRPIWFLYPELNQISNSDYLTHLLQSRPAIEGEKAEIKFLVGADPNPMRFMPIVHKASVLFELHRNSRKKPSAGSLKKYWGAVNVFGVSAMPSPPFRPLENEFLPPDLNLQAQAISDHLHRNVFSETWQPHVRNSKLYIQVSGPSHGHQSARAKIFIRKFGFPEFPVWSFEEDERTGTPGIHTDIFELSVPYYEWVVEEELKRHSPTDPERDFVAQSLFGPGARPFCKGILSRMEAGLVDALGFPIDAQF